MMVMLVVLAFACLSLAAIIMVVVYYNEVMVKYAHLRHGQGKVDASKSGEPVGEGHPRLAVQLEPRDPRQGAGAQAVLRRRSRRLQRTRPRE